MAHRLLLADDSMTIQKVVELTFSDSDFELLTVGSGDKAVEALAGFDPDVVLADAVMPGLSGYEVCEAVKRLPHGATIPVIILTGTFEPFDRARADGAGCDAIVTKPFDSHALAAQVKELVERAQTQRQAAPTMTMPTFEDIDLDRPDALYATTALRIPSPEEMERIAREEAEIRSTAASAEATPLFEVGAPAPEPAPAPPAPGSAEAMEYETTVPLEPPSFRAFDESPAAEEPFALDAEGESAVVPEATEEPPNLAEPIPVEQPPRSGEEPVGAEERYDATLPLGGRIEGLSAAESREPAAFAERPEDLEPAPLEEPPPLAFPQEPPAVAFAEEPIVVEPLVEEPPAPEPFAQEAAPLTSPEPIAAEPLAETGGITVEPLVEEDVFAEPPAEPLAARRADLGSGAEPEQGDIVEAIAAYERAEEPTPVDAEVGALEEPKEAEVSELEALAAHAHLDDFRRLIPEAGAAVGSGALSRDQVDVIARRVVELLGEKVVREVAWEVVPELAERLVRARLQELEGS